MKTRLKITAALSIAALALLAGCTSASEQYCNSYGVRGTVEYGKCLDYYHQQEAIFGADSEACSVEADMTYPRSLYDYGRTAYIDGGIGRDGMPRGATRVQIEPDYRHNAEIDALRGRIISPCMAARGWNSPSDWQAGRHPVAPVAAAPRGQVPANATLPWLK